MDAQPNPVPMRPAPSEPPRPVRVAVLLMWVGAAISVLGTLSVFLLQGQLRDLVEAELDGQGLPVDDQIVSATLLFGIVAAVIGGLIGTALWVLNAVFCGRGAAWSRILGTVLAGIHVPSTIYSLTQPAPAISKVLTVLSPLLAIAIVVLLWQRSSSAWFRADDRRVLAPPPSGPGQPGHGYPAPGQTDHGYPGPRQSYPGSGPTGSSYPGPGHPGPGQGGGGYPPPS